MLAALGGVIYGVATCSPSRHRATWEPSTHAGEIREVEATIKYKFNAIFGNKWSVSYGIIYNLMKLQQKSYEKLTSYTYWK